MTQNRLWLLSEIWDREKSIMVKYYYARGVLKKNKKAKNAYNKLLEIDSYTKEYLLKNYFEKCKLKFTVAFFE